jgi:HSP20 family protein
LTEALERAHDKFGHFLTRFVPRKNEDSLPEKITADAMPAFRQTGGPLLDMHETADELIISAEVPGLKSDDFTVEVVGRRFTIRGEKKSCGRGKEVMGALFQNAVTAALPTVFSCRMR